jgi:ribA/ribD-fused uncharacterized protein
MITTDTHVFFYGSIYSNFYGCKFTFEGREFCNSEQAFMWCKAREFNNHELADVMLKTDDPMSVKMMGRAVVNYDNDVWDKVRYDYMLAACLAKFAQNPELEAELLATGNRIIVEASPTDRIWGIGLAENDPMIYIESKWRGTNLLGKVLMDVRTQLTEGQK